MNILSRCEFTRADCSCYRLHVIIFLINKTLNMSGILCLTCCGQGLATYRSGVDLLQDLLAREIFFMYLEVKLLFLWTPLLAFSVVWWITWNNFLHRWVFFKPEAAQITFTSIWKLFFFIAGVGLGVLLRRYLCLLWGTIYECSDWMNMHSF